MPQRSPAIIPFWSRLGAVMAYPLQGEALVTLVALTAARILGFLPVLGWVIDLLITVALLKYGFEVLRASADGQTDAPLMHREVPDNAGWAQIGLQFVFIGAGLAAVLQIGGAAAVLVICVLATFYPAALMLLAMTGSLFNALNPASWLEVMRRLGGAYLVLALLVLLILASAVLFQGLVASRMPAFIGRLIESFASGWALLASYHLLGHVIFQYQDVLDHSPQPLPTPLSGPRRDPDLRMLEKAGDLVASGKLGEAITELRNHIDERGANDELHQLYRRLLLQAQDRAALLAHGQQYLNVLLANERDADALRLVADCQAIDPAFKPASAELVLPLAEKAVAAGQRDVALRLTVDFAECFPKHKHVPHNGLLAARLLCSDPTRRTQADQILRRLKADYPNHSLKDQIDALLAGIGAS
jgi:hypothetical protein